MTKTKGDWIRVQMSLAFGAGQGSTQVIYHQKMDMKNPKIKKLAPKVVSPGCFETEKMAQGPQLNNNCISVSSDFLTFRCVSPVVYFFAWIKVALHHFAEAEKR